MFPFYPPFPPPPPPQNRATLIRDVPYTMLELGLYENFKTLLKKYRKRDTLTTMEELGAAAVTGGLVGLMTNPLDLVKTRLMTGVRGTSHAMNGWMEWECQIKPKTPCPSTNEISSHPSSTHAVQTQYTGFMDVVSKMYKTEGGLGSFMSGSSARVMWLLPFTVIHLGVYECTFVMSFLCVCRTCLLLVPPPPLLTLLRLSHTSPPILVSKRVLADLKPQN